MSDPDVAQFEAQLKRVHAALRYAVKALEVRNRYRTALLKISELEGLTADDGLSAAVKLANEALASPPLTAKPR